LDILSIAAKLIKSLKGFNGVFEILNKYQTDTYHTIYAIKIDDAVIMYANDII
jgi:phage-related protein